jgi:hypothetical protein
MFLKMLNKKPVMYVCIGIISRDWLLLYQSSGPTSSENFRKWKEARRISDNAKMFQNYIVLGIYMQ